MLSSEAQCKSHLVLDTLTMLSTFKLCTEDDLKLVTFGKEQIYFYTFVNYFCLCVIYIYVCGSPPSDIVILSRLWLSCLGAFLFYCPQKLSILREPDRLFQKRVVRTKSDIYVFDWIKVTWGSHSKVNDMPFLWYEKHKTLKKQGF